MTAAIAAAAPGTTWVARYAHTLPPTVAIQRAAAIAGLAHLSPSHLCVHPTYGPWIGLRAVVVVDADGARARSAAGAAAVRLRARGWRDAFAAAVAAGVPAGTAELAAGWRRWLAVRDACPVGRRHRYDEVQLRYHYTKDPAALAEAIAAATAAADR
ncbi:MAG: hypothetical protein H6708_09270 [Kofleriaceae bacterium]|nr:hypothetical protein [Kofleriaceae bacterium]